MTFFILQLVQDISNRFTQNIACFRPAERTGVGITEGIDVEISESRTQGGAPPLMIAGEHDNGSITELGVGIIFKEKFSSN